VRGVFRGRPGFYTFEFCGIHAEFSFSNDYTEVVYFFAFEETFVGLEVEVLFLQFIQYVVNQFPVSSEVFVVPFGQFGFSVDGNVVDIHRKPSFGYFLLEDGVHHHDKGRRGVGKPKEHDHWLE
jgi:hypothetical protein